jgi:SAM-dependent methyltransferase
MSRYNSRVSEPPAFKDHFSVQSGEYQKYRPDYPPGLFTWLASVARDHRLAIDVATGNGQAAIGLAAHFDAVLATDPSAAQLREARPHARVTYRQEPAESISAGTASAGLLTAAQAAHWFDWPRFSAEAQRVLASGGLLAIWSYGNVDVTPAIDALVADFSRDVVGPYWPRERRHVDEGYRELELPFPAIEAPPFEMRTRWDAAAMLGYLDTWSAVRRCRTRTARDPLRLLAGPLADAWGEGVRDMRWPLTLKAGRA